MNARACAHRGDSSVFRENTRPALRSALAKGADVVEIDVRLTADGDVIVLHDPTLERLWGDARAVDSVPTADLIALGAADDRPPLLSEVLPLFVGSAGRLVIDMEEDRYAAPAFDVVHRFATHGVEESAGGDAPTASPADRSGLIVEWCGDLDAMRVLRALDPMARLWLPWREQRVPTADELIELNPVTVNVPYRIADAAFVEGVHDLGLPVTAWTLDEPDDLHRALEAGVDTITSNRLDLLRSMIAARAADTIGAAR